MFNDRDKQVWGDLLRDDLSSEFPPQAWEGIWDVLFDDVKPEGLSPEEEAALREKVMGYVRGYEAAVIETVARSDEQWEKEYAPWIRKGLSVTAKVGLGVTCVTGAMFAGNLYDYLSAVETPDGSELMLVAKAVRLACAIWLNKTIISLSREPVLQPGGSRIGSDDLPPSSSSPPSSPFAGNLCDPEDWDVSPEEATFERADRVSTQMAQRYANMSIIGAKEYFAENHAPSIKRVVDFGTVGNVAGLTRASFFATAALSAGIPIENFESSVLAVTLVVATAIMLKVRKTLGAV